MYRQLCEAVSSTAVNDVLLKVDSGNWEDFFVMYLYDFVRLVHKYSFHDSNHENRAYRVSMELVQLDKCECAV